MTDNHGSGMVAMTSLAGRPFLVVMCWGLIIKGCCRHVHRAYPTLSP
jgi:hypothetical protein